jgi:Tol biopolymer transport system component
MTIYTMDTETGEIIPTHVRQQDELGALSRTGWPYVFVRPLLDNASNWEIFLGDLEGGEPVRLTFRDGFNGFPSLSPDGTKMLFARSEGAGFAGGLTPM